MHSTVKEIVAIIRKIQQQGAHTAMGHGGPTIQYSSHLRAMNIDRKTLISP